MIDYQLSFDDESISQQNWMALRPIKNLQIDFAKPGEHCFCYHAPWIQNKNETGLSQLAYVLIFNPITP